DRARALALEGCWASVDRVTAHAAEALLRRRVVRLLAERSGHLGHDLLVHELHHLGLRLRELLVAAVRERELREERVRVLVLLRTMAGAASELAVLRGIVLLEDLADLRRDRGHHDLRLLVLRQRREATRSGRGRRRRRGRGACRSRGRRRRARRG